MNPKRAIWPSLVVIILLLGAGLVLFRPDWLPIESFRAANRPGPPAEAGLYCQEHGVPEKFCTLCHEELKSSLLACKEHGGIPEDICTLCHPEVEKALKIEMCPEGHGLPKHFCIECGNAPQASLPDDGWCVTHKKPEALCNECLQAASSSDPDSLTAPKVCRQPLPIVRLASAKLARQVGIETAIVTEETHAHRLRANAETAYDANRYAEICPRVNGYLREIRVDLGRTVAKGDVLAVVDAAEVGAAKTQLLAAQAAAHLAQVTYDRTLALLKSEAVPAKRELEDLTSLNRARADVMDAEQRLRNLGLDDAELTRIGRDKDNRNLLNVVAPIAGTVVLRHAVQGEAVQATTQLFAVADTSTMWIWIDIYENDIAKVAPGQPVSFTISGADPSGAGLSSLGEVTWIGTEVNALTRTSRIRAELANPSGRLRANQFGQAEIRIGDEHRAIVVPRDAVQREDGVDVVFLPRDDSTYLPRRVTTRPTDQPDRIEVTWGLLPGQRVVTRGSFLLKTEIQKGAIGAGCCE